MPCGCVHLITYHADRQLPPAGCLCHPKETCKILSLNNGIICVNFLQVDRHFYIFLEVIASLHFLSKVKIILYGFGFTSPGQFMNFFNDALEAWWEKLFDGILLPHMFPIFYSIRNQFKKSRDPFLQFSGISYILIIFCFTGVIILPDKCCLGFCNTYVKFCRKCSEKSRNFAGSL